jgi:hypothetical protein
MEEWRWMLVTWLRTWIHSQLQMNPTKVGDETDIDFQSLLSNLAHIGARDDSDASESEDEGENQHKAAAAEEGDEEETPDEDPPQASNKRRSRSSKGATPKTNKKKARSDE